MAQTDKSAAPTAPAFIVADLGEITKKRVEAAATAQAELFRELQEISRYWTARAKSETDLASELVSKLTGARSIPETATAYQEWASQRMQMALEDGQHLIADSFKLMETAARPFSNGVVSKST